MNKCRVFALVFIAVLMAGSAGAQVYSPKVLAKGQIDTFSLQEMAKGIYEQAGAVTPRQKAEAIWRFFLTDGRFVPPGFWYHIAGWTYEEPQGEVLDPLKLLNSYGFGLCYHIAPLLQAIYKAGGFEDARVWFLTGHAVTEVFYDGAYHYYDSDMLGYTTVGDGNPKEQPVASVAQIAHDGNIILSKLKSPTEVDKSRVDYPWYPADLRAAAIADLVSVFTSTKDNWLYLADRYPQAHSMEFVLRPGERLIRYFKPESEGLFYLPFKFDGKNWAEFPREIAQFNIRTVDGPRSQKDSRAWATGRLEYSPVLSDRSAYYPEPGVGLNSNLRLPDPGPNMGYLARVSGQQPARALFEMQSVYVLIDAQVALEAQLQERAQSLLAEVSVDGGKNWEEMARLSGPFRGIWHAESPVRASSQHGSLNVVSGRYQYVVRLTLAGPGQAEGIRLRDIRITSRFQLNPRTLPALAAGSNELLYSPGKALRRSIIPVQIDSVPLEAVRPATVRCVIENGQGILWPEGDKAADIIYELSAPDATLLSGFDAGARFLDLRDKLAPDKLTAELRTTSLGGPLPEGIAGPEASIAWSASISGKFATLWEYNPAVQAKDGIPVEQVLRWPEVDRKIRSLPVGTRKVYVRYRLKRMGMDSPRLAVISPRPSVAGVLEITHQWIANGQNKEHVERISDARPDRNYRIDIPPADKIVNHAVIFYCPPPVR
jgi:hypothetical protein